MSSESRNFLDRDFTRGWPTLGEMDENMGFVGGGDIVLGMHLRKTSMQ